MAGLLQRTLRHPSVEPRVAACLRGALVRESVRFALREMRGVDSTHAYRIRASGLRAVITHSSPDVLTLDEVFYQHVYEPPEEIEASLTRVGRPLRALDVGANIGLWGVWLRGRFAVERLIAVEPDPSNAGKHGRQIEINGLLGSSDLVQAAATCSDGPVPFTTGCATTGHIGLEGEPGTVTVAGVDVFPLMRSIDVLKMDIEGAEWPILADSRFVEAAVPVVVLEYHPEGAPSRDPESDVRRILAGAGYETWHVHSAEVGTGVVWGLRADQATRPRLDGSSS